MKLSSCTLTRLVSIGFWGTAFAFTLGILPNQYAYTTLDRGPGSFIVPLIMAGVLGVLLLNRAFQGRTFSLFRKTSQSCQPADWRKD